MEAADIPSNDQYKAFFSDLGVTWPEGSKISYMATIGKVEITNTPENTERVKDILILANLIPCMIEIQVDFVEFNTKDINTLTSKSELKIGSLHELWKQGKAKLLSNSIIQTKSGQEAIAKGVTEYIYPTEFKIKTALTPSGSVDVTEPQDFEMREAGNILQVVPEVMNGGRAISLLINPQLVSSPDWKQYGNGKNLNMQQPFFPSYSISTQVTIENGETVLLGGGMNNEAGDKTVYVFLTATIADIEGNPVRTDQPTVPFMQRRHSATCRTDAASRSAGPAPLSIQRAIPIRSSARRSPCRTN